MVVEEILGVVKVVPVPKLAPPVKAPYQFIVPEEAVATNPTEPVPHLAAGVVPVIVGMALTVAITAVLAAVVHPLSVAST